MDRHVYLGTRSATAAAAAAAAEDLVSKAPPEIIRKVFGLLPTCVSRGLSKSFKTIFAGRSTAVSTMSSPQLRWAVESAGLPLTAQLSSFLASEGRLEDLQRVHSMGCAWNSDTCTNAAQRGHLLVLKWARSKGCPWGTRTCSHAAAARQLTVLEWLRAQKPPCPWDCDTFRMAAAALASLTAVFFL